MDVTILFFFSGMISFVPGDDANVLRALLVNVEGHKQELVVPVDHLWDSADCTAPCSEVEVVAEKGFEKLCHCELQGAEVKIDTKAVKELPNPHPSGTELEPENADDIEWLVRMSRVNPKGAQLYPAKVAAKVGCDFAFGWSEATTCLFEEAACGTMRRIFGIDFPTSIFTQVVQPAPELVMFKSLSPTGLLSIKRDGKTANLRLKCPDYGCAVLIANSMYHADEIDLCNPDECTGQGGGHFLHYRKIAKNPVGSTPDRLCSGYVELDPATFPDVCFAGSKLADQLAYLATGKVTAGDRIICPPVVMVR
jgi:hypothetical protein